MEWEKFFSVTLAKLALFAAIFMLVIPCISFQVKFPCVQGQGCAQAAPVLLPPALSIFFGMLLPNDWSVSLSVDFLFLIIGLIPAYLLACAGGYIYKTYWKKE